MTAVLWMVLASAVTAGEVCYVPSEQTAGWKRVDVPEDAPALAAPADVDQFRAGEPAWMSEQDPNAYVSASGSYGSGKIDFGFRVLPDPRRLEVKFLEPLRGAKVDVLAMRDGVSFPIWSGRRVAEASIEVEWELPGVDQVLVRVHHHLRPVPAVTQWRAARWMDLAADLSVPAAFRVTRSLYFRHPGGRTLVLCDLPGQTLSVDRAKLGGSAASVSLRRQG